MKRVAPRAAVVLAVTTISLGACRNDGRDMRSPVFPPPAPTTSSTTIAVTPLSTG